MSPFSSKAEKICTELLASADIHIGGNQPQDIHVHHPDFFQRALAGGRLALGESYMDGWWDAEHLDAFAAQALRARLQDRIKGNRQLIWEALKSRVLNMQSRCRSTRVAREHYDLAGILPDPLLDPYNQYTCAYFDNTCDLHEAQEQKLDLICRKLQLREGDRVLDIGCGWGGFAKFSAERFGCNVTGISISEEQIKYARRFCAGLPVDIQNCDYRDLQGTYDKVLTCGMIEHVGYKNYRSLFQIINNHLTHDGLYLLHTIGSNRTGTMGDPFLNKYIFPNGMLPSLDHIEHAREGLFTLQDFQNLTIHYDPTCMAWHRNMQTHWPELSNIYDERFRRMFEYYLLTCAGSFRAGHMQHWQMVFSKAGKVMDYRGCR